MELFEFLDITFQNKSFENSKSYCIKREAELQAIHRLVDLERKFYRFLGFWKTVARFLGMKLGLVLEPVKIAPPPKVTVKEKPNLHVAENPTPVN